MVCTFFGHSMSVGDIEEELKLTLIRLIEENEQITFYVGNNGYFDYRVMDALEELKDIYPQIKCYVVLAYMPTEKKPVKYKLETIYPEGLETVPKRYAISRRNMWMISKCDTVVACAYYIGGARTFRDIAQKRGKRIIDLKFR